MPRKNPNKKSVKCSAKKKNGEPCPNWAMEGSAFCQTHAKKAGELTRFKAGTANPNYKDGRYSQALPERMRQAAEAAESDPELLTQRSEIALLTARLVEQIKNVDTRTSGQLWAELQATAEEFRSFSAAGDRDGVKIALNKLMRLIKAGGADYAAWEDIRVTVLDKNKLIASERKRLAEAKAFVTAEEGMAIIGKLAYAMRQALDQYVSNSTERNRVLHAVGLEIQKYVPH
jgi:small-conductance mechanosensitive channel